MILRQAILALAIVSILFARATPQTRDEDILSRQNDEALGTRSEREHALTVLLEAGRQIAGDDPQRAAQLLNRAGQLQLQLNSPHAALSTFQRLLSSLQRLPDSVEKVDALNGFGTAQGFLGKCQKAEQSLTRAVTLSEQKDYAAGKAAALLALSDCQNLSDHPLATRTAHEALALWLTLNNKPNIARAYSALGDYQMAQNDLIESAQNNEASLQIWRELGQPVEQAGCLINLGFIEYRKGAWQDCLSYLTQAQSLIDERAEPGKMAQIMAGVAETFIEIGVPETGLTKSQQSREYYRLAEDPRGVASMTWEIGKSYYLLGDHINAIATLNDAKNQAAEMGDQLVVASCEDFLGRTYAAIKDEEKALSHFEAASKLYEKIGKRREFARTRALIGKVYDEQGHADQARESYKNALATFEQLSDRVNRAATLYALGRLELRSEKLDLAENYLRESITATEDLRRISNSRDLTTSFSARVYERYAAYIDCKMRLHALNPQKGLDVEAFETSELARARSLTELLNATQTSLVAKFDQNLAAQEKNLRQSLRAKQDYKIALLSKDYKKSDLDSVDADLSRLEKEYQSLINNIRERYPAYEDINSSTALTLSQLQEQVVGDDQTLLLEYSLGIDRSYVWAISRNRFSSYELPGRQELEQSALELYQLLTAPHTNPDATFEQNQLRIQTSEIKLKAQIAKLSSLLLDPIAEKLSAKRLIIVADGAIQYVPFQSLVAPKRHNEPGTQPPKALIEEHEIINEPSASTLALLSSDSTRRRPAPKSVAIIADPVFTADDPRLRKFPPGTLETGQSVPSKAELAQTFRGKDESGSSEYFPRLPATRGEAAAIVASVPWRSSFEAKDFEANRTVLENNDFSQYRILHLATHARFNEDHPEQSGIVLSRLDEKGQPQNGYLHLDDIYNLNLPVDLVVLSACQTGLGKDVNGEGLIGLTRGFMYAGASGVVASLWKVDDDATAELMKSFYAGLFEKGLTPAAALRAAQLELRAQKRWQEPYYWAGFVIQGQYNQKMLAAENNGKFRIAVPVIVGLFLFALLGFRHYRSRPR